MSKEINKDIYYMRRAIEIAQMGKGKTSPNPMVGCIIVKNNTIIGEGYHQKAGEPHAEVIALNSARENVAQSTIYITLEPCAHFGKTPPCVNRIIESHPQRVVIAMEDPNPLVAGKGIQALKSAGIEIQVGVLEAKANKLNEVFVKYITTKTPYVIAKWAMTLDGKIATVSGDSKYISASDSLKFVHQLRAEVDAILVGGKTVAMDNPLLTIRHIEGDYKNPIRLILDTKKPLSDKLNIFKDKGSAHTWIVTTYNRDYPFADKIIKLDPDEKKYVPLNKLMKELGKLEITSVLIEGGGETLSSAFSQQIVDKVYCFVCPMIFGGKHAITPVAGDGIAQKVSESVNLKISSVKKLNNDILIESYIIK